MSTSSESPSPCGLVQSTAIAQTLDSPRPNRLPIPTDYFSPQQLFQSPWTLPVSTESLSRQDFPGLTQCPVTTHYLLPMDPLTSSSLTPEGAAQLLVPTHDPLPREFLIFQSTLIIQSLQTPPINRNPYRLTHHPIPREWLNAQSPHSSSSPYGRLIMDA